MSELAVITGASAGLGVEFARLFANDRADLVLVARRVDRLDALAEALRAAHEIQVTTLAVDLAEPGAAGRVVDALAERGQLDRVTHLVNNAGLGAAGRVWELDEGAQRQMMMVNMVALTELTHRICAGLVSRKRGQILNVGSMAGFQPGPGMAVYYATKAYVLSLHEALVYELRGTGVTATLLAPGAVKTEFDEVARISEKPLFRRGAARADEVARAGYRAMRRGKAQVIPGAGNVVGSLIARPPARAKIGRRICAGLNGL